MLLVKTPPAEDAETLEQAFARFSQASEKLEAKYHLLLHETERLRSELEKKEEEIRRTEKLASLGETAAALAHEVRNPLGAIRLFLSLLKKEVQGHAAAEELVAQIDKSAHALNSVVTNILQFSKNNTVSFAPVNVHMLLREQANLFSAMPECRCRFSLSLDGNPFVWGCEHSLRQVIHNVILNAVQATKQAGHVELVTSDSSDSMRIEVRDDGPGIAIADPQRIFDPFFTTKNEGTGLGLAVVRQIVERHGGSILVRSKQGAQFEIMLPRRGTAQR